jgi:hypothetical protein
VLNKLGHVVAVDISIFMWTPSDSTQDSQLISKEVSHASGPSVEIV